MGNTPAGSSRATDTFRIINLGELTNMIEKWSESCDVNTPESRKLAKGYYDILLQRVEDLSKKARKKRTDEDREAFIRVSRRLKNIFQENSDEVDFTLGDVKENAMRFLTNYSFCHFTKQEEVQGYLSIAIENQESWSSIKLGVFIDFLNSFEAPHDFKANRIIELLDSGVIRNASWTQKMYINFAKLLQKIQGRKKQQIKVMFNRLSTIQHDRKKGDGISKSNPWNTLYYKSMGHGGEAKGYPIDTTSRMRGALGPISVTSSVK